DDARVHGPHRDLEDALALDAAERERLARVGELAAQRHVAAERVIALGPELVEREAPRIGVAARREAEEVADLALEPARRERARPSRARPARRPTARAAARPRARRRASSGSSAAGPRRRRAAARARARRPPRRPPGSRRRRSAPRS